MPTSVYVLGLAAVLIAALFAVAYRCVRLVRAYHATDKYLQFRAVRKEIRRLQGELALADRPAVERTESELRRLRPILAAIGVVTFREYLRHRRATPGRPWAYVPPPADPTPRAAKTVGQRPTPPATPELPLPASVEAIATLLFGVARADGRLAASERAAVRRGLAKFFEGDPVLVIHVDPVMKRLASATLDIDVALRHAVALPRRERHLLRQCAEDVASATATRHAAKSRMVERLDRALTSPGDAPAATDPAELRSNELLDDMFGGPATTPPAARPVAAGQGLRDNALLDDVFGGT